MYGQGGHKLVINIPSKSGLLIEGGIILNEYGMFRIPLASLCPLGHSVELCLTSAALMSGKKLC